MQFNSPYFLFLFLPVCLLLYFVARPRYRNLVALAASLAFYAWGQWVTLPLMLLVIAVNYSLGRRIEAYRGLPGAGRKVLYLAIGLNLALLVFFKALFGYGAEFLAGILPASAISFLRQVPFPLGLSYIAFQVISYLIDIYNETCDSEKSLLNFSLYILLFPKILTGPITRYRDLAGQLTRREITTAGVSGGARRFITGLAKKILVADTLARVVNPAFALATPNFSTGTAWLVLVAYTIQLYFDFSGMVDMAIGLGQMLGFRFVENFNYPYVARSISEFWRRWHISLSSWFRDYVFYPLEFSRRRTARFRQQTNILLVFLLTGLWHGLTVNFVIWGLLHGLAIALEMTRFGRWLKRAWAPLQHLYALAVVMLGWLFFRSATPLYAMQFFARLFGSQEGITALPFGKGHTLLIINPSVWAALFLGIVFSMPLAPAFKTAWERVSAAKPFLSAPAQVGADLFLLFVMVVSIAAMVGSIWVPSIYGNF